MIIAEDNLVSVTVSQDYIFIPFRSGYTLLSAYGLNFAGIYVTGISTDGSANYILFLNVVPSSNSSMYVTLRWLKNI